MVEEGGCYISTPWFCSKMSRKAMAARSIVLSYQLLTHYSISLGSGLEELMHDHCCPSPLLTLFLLKSKEIIEKVVFHQLVGEEAWEMQSASLSSTCSPPPQPAAQSNCFTQPHGWDSAMLIFPDEPDAKPRSTSSVQRTFFETCFWMKKYVAREFWTLS